MGSPVDDQHTCTQLVGDVLCHANIKNPSADYQVVILHGNSSKRRTTM